MSYVFRRAARVIAGSGDEVESKAEFALGVGAGGEARGQSRGGQSKFGLRFS